MGPRLTRTSASAHSAHALDTPTCALAALRTRADAVMEIGADATRCCRRSPRARRTPITTCAASALRRCRSCCAWPRPRRCARVVSLLALDFVGVALAIFTALILKAVVLDSVQLSSALHETERILAFAYLLTALLFARSGLYAERAQRPGLSRIVGSLFQVAFVALLFAVVSGEHFSSYYLFYGSLAFALLYVSSLRAGYEWLTGAMLRAAGYRRRAVLVGTGKHIRDVAHALGDAPHSPIEVVGFLCPKALPANGLRALGSLQDLEKVLGSERIDEVIIADPGLPAGRGRGARRPVPPAGRARAACAVDDGDPDPPGRVRARPVGAAVRARAARVRGRRLRAQAHLRHRRRDAAAGRCSAPCCSRSCSRCGCPRVVRSCSARCAAASASGRSRA